eukprot:6576029-Ditylum_brightwellii.AAC.1
MLSSYYSTQWKMDMSMVGNAGFLQHSCDQKGEWVQLKEENAADSKHIGNNQLPITLANRWTPPLETGNPVVCYQQKEKPTCLFDAVASVLAYHGDNFAAQ